MNKNKINLILAYLRYKITSKTEYDIHSPFVFNFIQKILKPSIDKDLEQSIETIRQSLLQNNEIINIKDFGAGSRIFKSNERRISDIAGTSLKPKKFAQLLHRIIQFYKPKNAIELGTSLGISTLYQAKALTDSNFHTFEGDSSILNIAQLNFEKLHCKNIVTHLGNFDNTLPEYLKTIATIDYAFIDGNHAYIPTIHYFKMLKEKSNKNTILIFDDIHWSIEMESAWNEIIKDSAVTCSIDLFDIGIIFFNIDFKEKSHFVLKF